MRFQKYLNHPDLSDDENKFRALGVGLVTKETGHKNLVEKILEENGFDRSLLESFDMLNKDIKKNYRGKFLLDFCLEEGKSTKTLKIRDEWQRERLRKKIDKFKDELSDTVFSFERMKK